VTRSLRIAIIGASRFPIAEPFAGGLEAQIWALTTDLTRRGHQVTLFAAPGSDPALNAQLLPVHRPRISPAARTDVSMCPEEWLDAHHAYLQLMLSLQGRGGASYDVVHNHSLHYLPIAMADAVACPLVTTLHTPPTPWLESAVQLAKPGSVTYVAVSDHAANAWRHLIPQVRVVRNGIDTTKWQPGPGGGALVWSGRITPEKGTHLAVAAARLTQCDLYIAGPISDRAYFETEIAPHLDRSIRYLGHLPHHQLTAVVGAARACLVTPCWDEPFGLVVAEALACGTPIIGFRAGAIPELTDSSCAHLVPPGDVAALAAAISRVNQLSRSHARDKAVQVWSSGAMVDGYETLYTEVLDADRLPT
jgi:glycosyltransferase involved in cell wall biosynthesis